MLQQSMCSFLGCGVGLALGLQRRNLRVFVISISLGTIADACYGYMIACRPYIEDFNKCREEAKAKP